MPTARSYLGDPDFVKDMPVARLISKDYAAELRKTINPKQGLEVVADDVRVAARERRDDAPLGRRRERNAVSMTYTLEQGYGSKIVVPGAGFLLNNEMGDFNAGPGADRRPRA